MADDPLANMQNIIGYQGLVGPNPYLQYQGKIPMAGYYTGDAGNLPPTDATGKPIQSFVDYNNNAQAAYQQALAAYNAQPAAATPGTTLNSTPAGAGNPNAALMQYIVQQNANLQGSPSSLNPGGFGSGNNVASNQAQMQIQSNAQMLDQLRRAGGTSTPAAPARAPPPSPPDLRQAYLNALANPGKPPVYGAGPPGPGQAPTGTPPPSVMNTFLAANKGGNTPFLNTLRGLQNG